MRESYPSDISREQFEKIRPILESSRKKTRPRELDLYDVFCGRPKKRLPVENAAKRVSKWEKDTAEKKGYDAGKKISQRHIAVDTQGLPHAPYNNSEITDRSSAVRMVENAKENL
ncbi:hypothetical protein TNIN_37051 [Trichonephila inaurata madagascariensis]|uniref:Uncharacterized protein n=1 Tax=Trichonephila inaurata madagascariensis TaxID=2747483 RepID=A0A8X6Y6T7_9ARAC|nr:hypothetical protein TNIN_37051 [Trichonephila inaurata madagascariensis]